MQTWNGNNDHFKEIRQHLFSAVIGDVMDQLGLFDQFLPPVIQPLHPDMIVVGRAMPVLEVDVFGERSENELNPIQQKPFGLMFEALDDLKPDEVYICSGGSPNYALWGELMSTRARKLGAAGAVVDGFTRDTRGILRLGFPTFSHGRFAQDQGPRGKVVDFRTPVRMKNVWIRPGDLIFGDLDGVCVIPREAEEEIINRAIEKASGEKLVQKAIENGMSACEAYAKFGIM